MPTHAHMTPFISQVRVYDEPNGYARRIPYKAIMTVTHHSDTHVYLSAAVGAVDMATWNAAMAMLKESGVQTVQYERHGKMRTHKL